MGKVNLFLSVFAGHCNSRSDLRLQEDENEDKKSRNAGCKHQPYGKRFVLPKGIDKPASFGRIRHRQAFRNNQFLHIRSKMLSVQDIWGLLSVQVCLLNNMEALKEKANLSVGIFDIIVRNNHEENCNGNSKVAKQAPDLKKRGKIQNSWLLNPLDLIINH